MASSLQGENRVETIQTQKTHKLGLNAWTLAERKTCYVYHWDLYGGRIANGVPDVWLTHSTVVNIASPIFSHRPSSMDGQLFQKSCIFPGVARESS